MNIENLKNVNPDQVSALFNQHFKNIETLVTLNKGSSEDASELLKDSLALFLYNVKSPFFIPEADSKTYIESIAADKWAFHIFEKAGVKKLRVVPSKVIEIEDERLLEFDFDSSIEQCANLLSKWSNEDFKFLEERYLNFKSFEELATLNGVSQEGTIKRMQSLLTTLMKQCDELERAVAKEDVSSTSFEEVVLIDKFNMDQVSDGEEERLNELIKSSTFKKELYFVESVIQTFRYIYIHRIKEWSGTNKEAS